MKKLILIVTGILISINFYSQTPSFDWAYSFGGVVDDKVVSSAIDTSNNLYNLGFFNGTVDFDLGAGIVNLTSNPNWFSIFVQKIDPNSNLLWVKSIGGTNYADRIVAGEIIVDENQNIIIAGIFKGTVDFDPGAGVVNITSQVASSGFILKLDSQGNFLWVKESPAENQDVDVHENYNIYVSHDKQDSYYITGAFSTTVDFNTGIGTDIKNGPGQFITKYDSAGNYMWTKVIDMFTTTSWGYCRSICNDNNNNFYIAGHFEGTVDFDPGSAQFNLSANSWYDDLFIAKYDSEGNFKWAKDLNGQSSDNFVMDIIIDHDDNILITGGFEEAVDFDPGAGTHNLTPSGDDDIFIAKYDPLGDFIWAKDISYGTGNCLAIDMQNSVYVTGRYGVYSSIPTDFNPGAGIDTLTGRHVGIFALKLDVSGEYKWATSFHGPEYSYTEGTSIEVDSYGNVYVMGGFEDTVDFNPSIGVFDMWTFVDNLNDAFCLKLNQSSTTVVEENEDAVVNVYPNPTSGIIRIEGDYSKAILIDVAGKILDVFVITDNELRIDYNTGIYFLKLEGPEGNPQVFKILKK